MQLSAVIPVCGSYTSPFGLFREFAQFERFLENVLQSAAKLVEPGSQRDSITLCLRVTHVHMVRCVPLPLCLAAQSCLAQQR